MYKKLKVLVTATGAPGCSTLIRKLKNNGEREIEIIAVDSNPEVIGRFFSDKFFVVPKATEPDYIDAIKEIVIKENPDLIFPVSSAEVFPISKFKKELEELGCIVMVSDHEAIKVAINKYEVYKLMKTNHIPVPNFVYPKNLDEFISIAKELGYPDKRVCFKPHIGKGSRGFRILDEKISRKDLLLNYKPESRYISLNEFINIFKNEKHFPELILMEVIEGIEFDAMTICNKGEALLTTIKTREENRWGIITLGELVENEKIKYFVEKIIKLIPLSYNISLQFIDKYLIEINPRTSTYIFQNNLNEPYISIKLCLNELSNNDVKNLQNNVEYGRRMIRYMDQIFWSKNSGSFED